MQSNICEYCCFPKSRHADRCLLVFVSKLFEQNSQYRAWWDKGWVAGFNGDPEPQFPDDSADMAGNGWVLGRQARLDLEK